MSNFKIGEKVVCVNPSGNLKKGEIYEIERFETCACGDVGLNLLGVFGGSFTGSNCKCGRTCSNRAYSLFRFRKLDYAHTERICAEIIESLKVNETQLN